jgi:site-specific DNA-methyltransferase (adenine-specific)
MSGEIVQIGDATLYHGDCMDYMRGLPDKAFDLAIVDPPYGIGEDKTTRPSRGRTETKAHIEKHWDSKPPEKSYFSELMRISRRQIVWGANHFISRLPFDSSCWIVWNKKTAGNTADCELAWTSFDTAVRRFDFMWEGFWQENMKNKEARIHPTPKPVALYEWLLTNYAKPGDRILDTHLGSGSSAIAAHGLGFEFVGIELDADYYAAACERIARAYAQPRLFDEPTAPKPKQLGMLDDYDLTDRRIEAAA